MLRTLLVLLLLALNTTGLAIDSQEDFDDPVLQKRYEKLTHELRCLVCQNQSIADSTADLAADLRRKVREMMEQGANDADIRTFMVERYGDFVLYKPPFNSSTLVLWAAPAVLTALAILAFVIIVRRKARLPIDETSA